MTPTRVHDWVVARRVRRPDVAPGSPPRPFVLPAGTDTDRFWNEVGKRQWFHRFEFDDGRVTPGVDPTMAKLPWMLPDDLTGKRVLDVGAYDGFFSFEAERRGAADVLATDDWSWSWPGSDARGNFELMREALGSEVRDRAVAVEDLGPETVGGTYDVVLFYGVLYHAPDPLGYLRRVRSVTGEVCIVETFVDLLDVEQPALAFYEGAALNGDGSNHFGPNRLAVESMLREAGFARIDYRGLWDRNTRDALAGRHVGGRLRSGRMVFHAWT